MASDPIVKQARPVLSPADRDAAMRKANQNAKKQFADKFEGAHIALPIELYNRSVTRAFSRTFHVSMRNWYTATTVPRSAIGDSALANQVEAGMLKKIAENVGYFKGCIERCNIIANDAEVDFSLISHSKSFNETTKVFGPVAMQLHMLFKLADKYIDLMSALYSFQAVPADESSNANYEVKKRLDAVSSSIRNFRIVALRAVNERGAAREGFQAVAVDSDELPAVLGDASNVTPISNPEASAIAVEQPGETPAPARKTA